MIPPRSNEPWTRFSAPSSRTSLGSTAGQVRAIYIVAAAEIDEGNVIDKDLDGIIADPVGVACRSEIAALGSLLFKSLGTAEPTVDVLARIAGMDPACINQRRAILDEAWTHVGPEGAAGLE